MTDRPPPTRRTFAHPWDEIEYLYHKVLHWAYGPNELRKARKFVPRLTRLLQREDPDEIALLGLSARALMADISGRFEDAIRFRIREIETIEYLMKLGGAAAQFLDPDDVSDRMDLLAILYWDSGKLELARKTLEESRSYCRRHRIPFDGQDLIDELSSEMATSERETQPSRNGTLQKRPRSPRKLASR